MQPHQLSELLPKVENKTTVLVEDAMNSDIINSLNSMLPAAAAEVAELATRFKKDTAEQTAFAIWYFLRTRAKYVRDTTELQLIRTPKRFVYDTWKKNNSGDCKSFSLFAAAILKALKMPVYIQYAGYTPGVKMPSHVYVFTKDENGNRIIIDGCYPFFNREKKYSFTKIYNMKVAALSGVTTNREKAKAFFNSLPAEQKKIIREKLLKRQNAAATVAVNEVLQGDVISEIPKDLIISAEPLEGLTAADRKKKAAARKKKVKEGFKKFGRGVAFLTMGVGRGAYLALVALNINAYATKFKKLQAAKMPNGKSAFDEKILPFWKKIGGLKKLLLQAIDKGAKHKPLFLSKKAKQRYAKQFGVGSCEYIGDLESINAIPVAAAAAAAIPVVAAIIPVMIKAFASIGKRKEADELAQQGNDLVQEQQQPGRSSDSQEQEAEDGAAEDVGALEQSDVIGAADWGDLFDSLGKVAAAGVQKLGQVIEKKTRKNPKARKAIETAAQAGDDYFTGQYLRESGAKGTIKKAAAAGDMLKEYAPFLFGGAVLLYVLKGKSK